MSVCGRVGAGVVVGVSVGAGVVVGVGLGVGVVVARVHVGGCTYGCRSVVRAGSRKHTSGAAVFIERENTETIAPVCKLQEGLGCPRIRWLRCEGQGIRTALKQLKNQDCKYVQLQLDDRQQKFRKGHR